MKKTKSVITLILFQQYNDDSSFVDLPEYANDVKQLCHYQVTLY